MKLFPPLIIGVKKILTQVFKDNKTADKVVAEVLKSNPKWGSRDRKMIAEVSYNIIRNFLFLKHLAKTEDIDKIIPFYTDVFVENKYDEKDFDFQTYYSIPDFLYQYGCDQMTEPVWKAELKSMHSEAPIYLRVNTMKTDAETLCKQMIENGFDCKVVPITFGILNQNCIELLQRKKLTSDPLFESGLFEIQDIGSQCIAPFLNPKSNTTVIDACSGAGGKALHIASMMNKTGNIIALDIHKNKLTELTARAKRQGVGHIQTHLATGDMLDQYKAKADYLLLDVPCTGVGTLKRQADLKYKINESFIGEKNSEQQKILQNYSAMLSPNGEMVYATCSLFPSENEEIIKQFLKANVNFELVESNYIRPSEHKSDGFFMAKMKKR